MFIGARELHNHFNCDRQSDLYYLVKKWSKIRSGALHYSDNQSLYHLIPNSLDIVGHEKYIISFEIINTYFADIYYI